MLLRPVLTLLLLSSLSSAATVFNFDAVTPDTYTPFSQTVAGVTATFSSNGDPGGFSIATYQSPGLSGQVLFQPGPADMDGLSLVISFSRVLTGIGLNFALNGPLSATFELQAYSGGVLVGDVTAGSKLPPGAIFPEGSIAFGNTTFDQVVLSSNALDFAIDNVAVDASNVPEPGTLGLAGFVLLGGVTLLRKRRAF